MFKSVWYTYNINEPICQWSLFVLSLGAGMAPSPKHSQDLRLDPRTRENGAAGETIREGMLDKRSYNGLGQERAMAVNSYSRLGSLSC
jgi:hypothetical protein